MTTSDNDNVPTGTRAQGDDRVTASATKHMTDQVAPLKKRFYKSVAVISNDDGFGIALDDRPIRTPSRQHLRLPTKELADAIAAEWSAQEIEINPVTMPLTRIANTVMDGVATAHGEVAADIARFAMTDLFCYRVNEPVELVERQKDTWDPVLAWVEDLLSVTFNLAVGVMPVTQDEEIEARIARRLASVSAFELAPLHIITTLTGSAVLALAIHGEHLNVDAAWAAAHLDEEWQVSQWGDDEEAAARREWRRQEMLSAARFLQLSGL